MATMAHLAWPCALSILARIAMGLTDLAVLGHLDTESLAAAAAALIWLNVTSQFLFRGINSAINIMGSQAYGAKNYQLCGIWFQQGLIVSSIACIPVGASWLATGRLLRLLHVQERTADLAQTFANYSLMWLLPLNVYSSTSQYFQAQEIVLPALVVNITALVLNLGLNLVLVHGLRVASLGIDWAGLGFIGSPIATTISRVFILAAYLTYMVLWKRLHRKTWPEFGWSWTQALRRDRVRAFLVQQALPLSIAACLEEWQLQVIAVFAARLGPIELTTHTSTLEVFMLLTALMFGLTSATSVRIGRHLGARRPDAAKQVSRITGSVALCLAAATATGLALLRSEVGHIYSNDPRVWAAAESIMVIVAVSYVALSVFYTSMSVLDGQGRPGIVALSFFIGAWCVAIPCAYVLAFSKGLGLRGLWYGLCCGYTVVTLIAATAFLRSDWRRLSQRAYCKHGGDTAAPSGILSEDARPAASVNDETLLYVS